MPNILALHHASLLVSDTERALRFYRDCLGLRVDASRPALSFPGAWFSIGQSQVHLLELLPAPPAIDHSLPCGRDRHIAFIVADLAELCAALDQNGIPYHFSQSGRRALFCRDPDGNALEFIEQ